MQILAEILDLCRKPQLENGIMCKANISNRLLQHCLEQLVNQNLLETHHGRNVYSTTEKGLEFLQICLELQQAVASKRSLQDSSRVSQYCV
jgi:predicted transcriptional regulator